MSQTIFDQDRKRRDVQRRELSNAEALLRAKRFHDPDDHPAIARAQETVIHARLRYWGWIGKLPQVAT